MTLTAFGVWKEIYRLHCSERDSKEMRFRDLAIFIKGVLSNSTEPESLQLIAQRLRCTRIVVGDDRMRTTHMDIPLHRNPFVHPVTTTRPVSGYTPSRLGEYEIQDPLTRSNMGRRLEVRPVERQGRPYASDTMPYLPSHLPALLVSIPSKAHTSAQYVSQQKHKVYVRRRLAKEVKPVPSFVYDGQNPT
jgi:hypothetical protein